MDHIEGEGGSHMQNIESPGAQLRGVSLTQLGGEIERTSPERIDENQAPSLNIGIEVVECSVCDVSNEQLAVHRELHGVD
ncbi:MAG TPA: hypothetical protein VI072_29700 [Polyangiaceae bacterium]